MAGLEFEQKESEIEVSGWLTRNTACYLRFRQCSAGVLKELLKQTEECVVSAKLVNQAIISRFVVARSYNRISDSILISTTCTYAPLFSFFQHPSLCYPALVILL